jgi:hypothetical protein
MIIVVSYFQLSKCVSDLKAIVQLCTARKNGEDPNMSLLLGIRGKHLFFNDKVCYACFLLDNIMK